jgi:hypothetical protein
MHSKFWLVNFKGRDHSEDLGVDGRIIVKCILGKQGERLDSSCSSNGLVAGCCEQDNEHSGSIKIGKFLDKLSVLSASQEGFYCIE